MNERNENDLPNDLGKAEGEIADTSPESQGDVNAHARGEAAREPAAAQTRKKVPSQCSRRGAWRMSLENAKTGVQRDRSRESQAPRRRTEIA